VVFSYRGVEMKFLVHDTREEVELKTCAALKEHSVRITDPQPSINPSKKAHCIPNQTLLN
jgi:hypothetical protein